MCCNSWGRKELDTTEQLNCTVDPYLHLCSFGCLKPFDLLKFQTRVLLFMLREWWASPPLWEDGDDNFCLFLATLWDLSSRTRDWTCTLCILALEVQSLNDWTTREIPRDLNWSDLPQRCSHDFKCPFLYSSSLPIFLYLVSSWSSLCQCQPFVFLILPMLILLFFLLVLQH